MGGVELVGVEVTGDVDDEGVIVVEVDEVGGGLLSQPVGLAAVGVEM